MAGTDNLHGLRTALPHPSVDGRVLCEHAARREEWLQTDDRRWRAYWIDDGPAERLPSSARANTASILSLPSSGATPAYCSPNARADPVLQSSLVLQISLGFGAGAAVRWVAPLSGRRPARSPRKSRLLAP